MRLYSYYRSSSAYRVRIAMNLKNLDYEIQSVHLLQNGGKQYSEDYKGINPYSQVPTLEVEGQFLSQSMAICLYLEDAYPDIPLLASNAWEKAQQIAFCEVINSGIQPLQNLSVIKKLDEKYKLGDEGKKQWIQENVNLYFAQLDKQLSRTSDQFCFGSTPSLADCFLIPQIFSAKRFGVDMNRFPSIDRIGKETENIDAFSKAHPSNQPDAE